MKNPTMEFYSRDSVPKMPSNELNNSFFKRQQHGNHSMYSRSATPDTQRCTRIETFRLL